MKKNTVVLTACLFLFVGCSFGLVGNCTIYVSPSGGGNGTTAGSPNTLASASSASVPGSVICIEAGTYNLASDFSPAHSGTAAGGYITYIAYGNGAANFVWTAAPGV